MNDIVLNKAEIIERTLARVKQTYAQYAQDLAQAIDRKAQQHGMTLCQNS